MSADEASPSAEETALAVRAALARLRRRILLDDSAASRLAMGSWTVLMTLAERGPLPVGALAVLEQVQPPSMTRTVNALIAAGHVSRQADGGDARVTVIALTESGHALVQPAAVDGDWLTRKVADLPSEERQSLVHAAALMARLARG